MKQALIALDQLLNTLLFWLPGGAWADETLSARAWRMRDTPPFTWLRPLLDAVFFFDPQHCYTSWLSEIFRNQSPPGER